MKTSCKPGTALQSLGLKRKVKNKKGLALANANTKPRRQLIEGIYETIKYLGEDYATLTTYEFAKVLNRNSNMLVIRHGDIVAIKKGWIAMERKRFLDTYRTGNITLYTEHFYQTIQQDSRSVDAMLTLGDYNFFIAICAPFKQKINAHYGDFLMDLIRWLRSWQTAGFTDERELYWLKLANIINNYVPSTPIPATYKSYSLKMQAVFLWQNTV